MTSDTGIVSRVLSPLFLAVPNIIGPRMPAEEPVAPTKPLLCDEPLKPHANGDYRQPAWPDKPLFYVSCPSQTDATVAPEGMSRPVCSNPARAGIDDTEVERERSVRQLVMERRERLTEQPIRDAGQ